MIRAKTKPLIGWDYFAGCSMRVMRLAIGFLLAVALGIGFASLAGAQSASIQIAELQCNGDPEFVRIENTGSTAQALTGWKLESDPASEVFDLSVISSLQPDASIIIQAGPSATGVFKWGTELVFRDDDSTDYVRIVDDAGATVGQENCAGATPATPSPTATVPDGVPDGGGAPPLPDDPLTAIILIASGLGIALAGAAAVVVLLRARPAAIPLAASAPAPAAPAPAPAESQRSSRPVRRPSGAGGPAVKVVVGFAALGLLVALAFLLLHGRD